MCVLAPQVTPENRYNAVQKRGNSESSMEEKNNVLTWICCISFPIRLTMASGRPCPFIEHILYAIYITYRVMRMGERIIRWNVKDT